MVESNECGLSAMQNSKTVSLSLEQREVLIKHINDNSLNSDDKEVIIKLLDLYADLREKLQSSDISIKKLQELLLGFKSDRLKKLLQIQQ